MKRNFNIPLTILSVVLFAACAIAGVPLKWVVDTSKTTVKQFDAWNGETLDLEATLCAYRSAIDLTGKEAMIYWQTNGMGSVYWQTNATVVASNVLVATFTPDMNPDARAIMGFIGVAGEIYRAAFSIRFSGSPGALPNVIDQPPRVLDLANTVVINPPWPTDETIDARIRQVIDDDHIVAPVETNVVTGIISNTVTRQFVEDLGISGGGVGGLDTNAVELISNRAVETNAVTVAATNDIRALVSATNDLASSVSSHASQLSQLSQSKRDLTNNVCAADSLTWTLDAIPYGFREKMERQPVFIVDDYGTLRWFWFADSWGVLLSQESGESARWLTRLTFYDPMSVENVFPARLERIATSGESYVTQSFVTNKADRSELEPVAEDARSAYLYSRLINLYMTANTNAWFAGTNYVFGADAATRQHFAWEPGMDAATVPCSMALYEIRDGSKQCVWDQRDWVSWYWSFKANQMREEIAATNAAIYAAITNDENNAWARRYAATGRVNPDADTTYIDTKAVCLSPGMNWETVATVGGCGYWTIVGNGAVIGGSGTNAVLDVKDFEGNSILRITKGEHRLAWLDSGDFVGQMTDADGWVCFDMMANVQPVGYFSTTLESADFVAETDTGCPAQYRWENLGNGKWRVHFLLKPGVVSAACFAKFQVDIEGKTQVQYNADTVISGGLIFDGVKIAPVIPSGAAVGSTVTWKVVQ